MTINCTNIIGLIKMTRLCYDLQNLAVTLLLGAHKTTDLMFQTAVFIIFVIYAAVMLQRPTNHM